MAPQYNAKSRKQQKQSKSIQTCQTVSEALQNRARVVREISTGLSRINDILLTEYQIRDLNDDINKLLYRRRAWEKKIKELGGPDFTAPIANDSSFSIKGYRYFGRARELPDVVKLLEEVTLEKTNAKSLKNTKKALASFKNPSTWPGEKYPLDSSNAHQLLSKLATDKVLRPCEAADHLSNDGILTFEETALAPPTQDLAEMGKFVLQYKKQILLKRIRAKSNRV